MKNVSLPDSVKYSILFLLEAASPHFAGFLSEIYSLFTSRGESFEIIIVANGCGHFVRREIACLENLNGRVRAYEMNKNTSRTVALRAGFEESRGEVIVVCGSLHQVSEASILGLVDALDEQTDIVNSWRSCRGDSRFNQVQSRVFNRLVGGLTQCRLHDVNSATKVFRREVLQETELYGNLSRFLPVVAAERGFKIKEVECRHPQWQGSGGMCRVSDYAERLLDIITLVFVTRFTKKPLRFFCLIGLFFVLLGLSVNVYVFMEKLFLGEPIGGRLGLLLGILLMVIGVQSASTGLLGEIIAFTHGRKKVHYTIEKQI